MFRSTDTRRAWCMSATRRDITAPSYRRTAWSCTARDTTTRHTSARPSGCPPPTPTAWEARSLGAQLLDGLSDLVWAWRSAPGAGHGGVRSDIGDGAGELQPGDGEDGA